MQKLTITITGETWAALEATLLLVQADIHEGRLAGQGFTMHSNFSFSVTEEEESEDESDE